MTALPHRLHPRASDVGPVFPISAEMKLQELQQASQRNVRSDSALRRTLPGVLAATLNMKGSANAVYSHDETQRAERLLAHEGFPVKEHIQQLHTVRASLSASGVRSTRCPPPRSHLLFEKLHQHGQQTCLDILQKIQPVTEQSERANDHFLTECTASRLASVFDVLAFVRSGGVRANQRKIPEEVSDFQVQLQEYAKALKQCRGLNPPQYVEALAGAASAVGSDLTSVWSELHYLCSHRLSYFFLENGPRAPHAQMALVVATRELLESKFSHRVLHNSANAAADTTNALREMPPQRFRETVRAFCQQIYAREPDEWMAIFHCMKAGRYDAAMLVTKGFEGVEIVSSVLGNIARMLPEDRQEYSSPDAVSLLHHGITGQQHNAFRTAVLILLSFQHIAEEEAKVELQRVMSDVCMFGEDETWLRLCLIRSKGTQQGAMSSLMALQHAVLRDAAPVLSGECYKDSTQVAKQLMYAQLFSQALREVSTKVSRTDVVHLAIALTIGNLVQPSKVFDTEKEVCSFLRDALRMFCDVRHTRTEAAMLCKGILPYFELFPERRRAICIAEVFCSAAECCHELIGDIMNDGTVLRGAAFPQLYDVAAEDLSGAAYSASRKGKFRVAANMWLQLYECSKGTYPEALRYVSCVVDVTMTELSSNPCAAVCDYAMRLGLVLHSAGIELTNQTKANFFALSKLVQVRLLLERRCTQEAFEVFLSIEWIPTRLEDVPDRAQRYINEASDVTVNIMRQVLHGLFDTMLDLSDRSSSDAAMHLQPTALLLYRWVVSTAKRNGREFTASFANYQKRALLS